jgi:hypothetical protein
LFILEETLLDNGVATPLNQIQFPDGNQAMSAFSVYIKQSDNHIITAKIMRQLGEVWRENYVDRKPFRVQGISQISSWKTKKQANQLAEFYLRQPKNDS